MKRPFLVLLALLASVGFGAWLVRTPHELREILTACLAWVLGFWLAAAIQARRRRPKPARRKRSREVGEDQDEDDTEDEWDDSSEDEEEWDESEDEEDDESEDEWDDR
jgi:hypothetical protein